MSTKVIAFDMLGTAIDPSGVDRDEIRAYLACCTDRPWLRQQLPESWKQLPAFEDTREGIRRLRTKFIVVPLSNLSSDVIKAVSEKAGVVWDDCKPLEYLRTYKPDPMAYLSVCEEFSVQPADVLMVTANPTFGPFPFGDIEMAKMLGMQAQLIRNPGCPQTITDLADQLGC